MRAIIITYSLLFFISDTISQNKEPYVSQNYFIYKECVNKILKDNGYCDKVYFSNNYGKTYKKPENIILVLKEPLLKNIEINDTINGFYLIDIAEKDLYAYLKQNPSKNFFVLSIYNLSFNYNIYYNTADILSLCAEIKLTIYNDKTNPFLYNNDFCNEKICFKYLKDNNRWRLY